MNDIEWSKFQCYKILHKQFIWNEWKWRKWVNMNAEKKPTKHTQDLWQCNNKTKSNKPFESSIAVSLRSKKASKLISGVRYACSNKTIWYYGVSLVESHVYCKYSWKQTNEIQKPQTHNELQISQFSNGQRVFSAYIQLAICCTIFYENFTNAINKMSNLWFSSNYIIPKPTFLGACPGNWATQTFKWIENLKKMSKNGRSQSFLWQLPMQIQRYSIQFSIESFAQ